MTSTYTNNKLQFHQFVILTQWYFSSMTESVNLFNILSIHVLQ